MGKTVEQGRKAIVSLTEVQEAFTAYGQVRAEIGADVSGHTFDRGARGKGFAQYDAGDNIVRSFEGKEEALNFFRRYVEVAREVMAAPLVTVVKPSESDAEAPKVPSQRGRKAKDVESV